MQNFFFSLKMTKFSALFLLTSAIAILAGCTAADTSSTTTPPPATGTAVAATIQLSVSLPQILSTATSTSNLTAIVLDATGQAISGKAVTFSVGGDTTAYYTNVSATTNVNGVATATLNIGSNMVNRTITVSATADAAVGTSTVQVTGTTIAITGNTSLALNAATALTISVKNSAGVAVPGVPLTVASLNGNGITLTPATGITDANGQIVATVTATSATTPDTITVTGAGATQTQALTVTATSTSFAFTAPITIVPPATTPEILVNTPTAVSVLWTVNGVPQTGQTINFYTTRGTITASAITDGSGVATASVSAASTGATILTAVGPGNTPTVSLNVVFITNTATSITAQASPSTIGVNVGGSTTNQSVISVVVRDAALNLVKNANVSFSLAADPSGGSLSAAVATTNIAGTATASYISGGSPSPSDGEVIQVTVNSINGIPLGVPITTTTALTVAGQSIFVRLQTDNTVISNGAYYSKRYYALVTDSGGNPIAGKTVSFTLRPTLQPFSFFKGSYALNPVTNLWEQTVEVSCANEDTNLNGFLDIGEDTNGNTFLDPDGIASVNASDTTDAYGYAIATITYVKNYATWAVMDLQARTNVTSNDPPAVVTVPLVGAAADYGAGIGVPPGQISPFGEGAAPNNVCTNAL
jgi:hypothetical protein